MVWIVYVYELVEEVLDESHIYEKDVEVFTDANEFLFVFVNC